jgi:aminopeptidase N
MTRDAEMRTRDFLALVGSGGPSITEITVLERVLRMTAQAVRRYTDPAWRETGLAQLDDTLRNWLLTAAPGSDQQLAYAKALAGVAASTASLDLLAGLLAGTESIDGLAVDTDLRWELVHRLASRGLAGTAEIEAELDRDRTDAGERQAESCLAAIPTTEAKAAAWAKITGGALPNATFRAVLRGFRDPDQDELLAPYATKFYAALADMWQDGASDMAQFFTEVGYPDDAITQEAIDATDDYIATADPVAAMRRLLIERRDDVARALRCRERDARPS